jgi:hypothetical protein
MRFGRTKGIATLALLLTLPVAACDGGTDTEFGSMSIQLTDAVGDEVVEAWVTITDIYLQEQSGENDPEGSRYYLLEDASETEELLSLANDVADLVVGQEVPTGTYGQLRIVISDGCIVTDDGTVFSSSAGYDLCGPADGTLNMPSFAQTGAKVLLNGLQVTGGQQILLLDFDVSESFGREAGGSGMWVMQPVIHASDITLTVGIDVTLSDGDVTLPEGYALGQFSATLLPAEGDSSRVSFTDADGNGIFELAYRFLLPDNGPFNVRLNVPDGLVVEVSPDSPVTVSPASGETGNVDWVIQSAGEEQAQ